MNQPSLFDTLPIVTTKPPAASTPTNEADKIFAERVAAALRWQGAHMKAELAYLNSDKKVPYEITSTAGKSHLDDYLTRRFSMSDGDARDISNHITAKNLAADETASLEEFKDESWAGMALNELKIQTYKPLRPSSAQDLKPGMTIHTERDGYAKILSIEGPSIKIQRKNGKKDKIALNVLFYNPLEYMKIMPEIDQNTPGLYPSENMILALFPGLDKNTDLAENDKEIKESHNIEKCQVVKTIRLTTEEYDKIGSSLSNTNPLWKDIGGTQTNHPDLEKYFPGSAEYYNIYNTTGYTLVVKVEAEDREPFVVNTEGYDYARYVGRIHREDIPAPQMEEYIESYNIKKEEERVVREQEEARKRHEEGMRQARAQEEKNKTIKVEFDKIKPAEAKAIIVAECQVDESESMSDYFHVSTSRTILLGFSNHTRDIFSEMRKACENSETPEIRAFAEIPTTDSDGYEKTEENKSWWNPSDEHREKYSMGAGYYLKKGSHYSSGWAVRKIELRENWALPDNLELDQYKERLKTPKTSAKTPKASAPSKIDVTVNEEKNGIEIRFPGKPSPEVLETLKNARWRWSRHSQAWYNKNTPENMKFAKTAIQGQTQEDDKPEIQNDNTNGGKTTYYLTFHEDSGHGWLEIPKQLLKEFCLQDKITNFSYQSGNGETVYLEEDQDAGVFLQAIKAQGHEIKIKRSYENDSFVRTLQHYKPTK